MQLRRSRTVRDNTSTAVGSAPNGRDHPVGRTSARTTSAGHLSVHLGGPASRRRSVSVRTAAEAARRWRSLASLAFDAAFVLVLVCSSATAVSRRDLDPRAARQIRTRTSSGCTQPGPGRRRRRRRQQDEGAAAQGGAAGQGQDHGSGREAAGARGAARQAEERAESGRAAEHSGEDARGGATNSLPGAIDAPPGRRRLSQGSGSGGGAGTGTGTGIGPGTGSGLGPGSGGGTGGGVYRPGSGVTTPAPDSRGRSRSTPPTRCARRFRAPCCVECVVQPDGIGHRRAGRPLARSDVRSRSGSDQGRAGSGGSGPARAWASRSPVADHDRAAASRCARSGRPGRAGRAGRQRPETEKARRA